MIRRLLRWARRRPNRTMLAGTVLGFLSFIGVPMIYIDPWVPLVF